MLEKLSWPDIRNRVYKLNPGLACAIDAFEPDDSYAIYRATYPWGDHILHEGRLMLPQEDGSYVRIDDPSVATSLRDDLNYNNTIPLGMVLDHSLELYYLNPEGRYFPYGLMMPGKLFAM